MSRNAIPGIILDVLPMVDLKRLSIKEASERFAARALSMNRAFAEMGKLHFVLSANLPKGRTIYGELRKLGVRDTTIANAAYASKVWGALIEPKHLTEKVYDSLTFEGCRNLLRALGKSGTTRKKLEPADLTALWKSAKDPEAELTSLVETGLTVVEAKKKAAADAAAEAAAAEKAAKSGTPAPATATPPDGKAAPAAPSAPLTATPAPAGSPAPAPAAKDKPDKTAAPPPKPKLSLADCIGLCDALELGIAGLSAEDQCVAANRVLALAKLVTDAAAKAPAAAQKAAADKVATKSPAKVAAKK